MKRHEEDVLAALKRIEGGELVDAASGLQEKARGGEKCIVAS